MAEEESKKVEVELPCEPTTVAPAAPVVESPVKEEKTVIPPPADDECKALAVVDTPESTQEKPSGGGSQDRDIVLARVETEKRLSLLKAWEENEKTKAENKNISNLSKLITLNRAYRKTSAIGAWENSKKASVEAQLKKIEEKLEKKKAEYLEKMQNKIAMIHKEAEEKRAMVAASKGEDLLKAEETAAKYRATQSAPKKLMGCFGA
ncbi:hypothetical protein GIB67_003781 [Kingdonia uniflora]|uniref:Remorin n=1 Tax=Kingdonia uniflora TaxID=39325 RepID=A0A7J7M1K5_9MAGN|nr:hypothetical protein GIB67_003781 [Kingdonia uniflora]